jgi:uncharacterized damage-inducible protein DinB
MQPRSLISPEGYNPRAVAVRALAAQLDPLLKVLTARVKDATTSDLEWQPRPGTNTIGMLLAHLAVTETFWLQAGAQGIDSHQEVDTIVHATLGIHIDDDGLPLPPHASHPPTLAGKTAADYLDLLHRARQATHATLRAWDDSDLERIVTVDGNQLTRGWILYHVVEHFAQHTGQIALLASLRRRTVAAD